MIHAGLAQWHRVVKSRDIAGLDEILAEDVMFYSPVVHTPQVGKAITYKYLSAALQVLNTPDFKYLGQCTEGRMSVLEFETKLDGITVNGVDIIGWSADGSQIESFKVMVRPLKAVNAVHQAMMLGLQKQA
jgi:SnoaL-like domain